MLDHKIASIVNDGLPKWCTTVHSHQQCVGDLLYIVFHFSHPGGWVMVLPVVFIYISLITNEAEHLFMSLSAIWFEYLLLSSAYSRL